ncbi:TetR/AcrR family transcriptional regulator [Ulvibacterium marinum]|uniref:TetR/AcrR family transcriptional regulator n=1 Tax=Ulvibacterium marinum TaxID=2419782 RepID=A0A3B0C814_9FLAO|nr:TetR/AcrR family transcriptional regulator [Ulvibacterium marinum]RKN79847.1 TetR/AcrR family transcriptional regulator [Ulvibacterium marinum]
MNQTSTKEKIIAMSLDLFNRSGVENITTRHIAKELGISQGNLHYHYPNKDKLLETLFSDMLTALKSAERIIEDKPLDPQQMLLSMTDNFKIMYSYRLFFQQNDVIWRRLPEIKEVMTLLFQTKQSEILALIELYKKEGKFREEISARQVEFLAEQFIFNIQSWLNVKDYNPDKVSFAYYAKLLFRLWLPYLHPTEMKTWEKLLD